jgi:dimethylaniline monooxygenase (N-oxide forming)
MIIAPSPSYPAVINDTTVLTFDRIPSLQFFSQYLRKELGLPHFSPNKAEGEKLNWTHLGSAADQIAIASFPQPKDRPPQCVKPVISIPYRLYKLIAPISNFAMPRKTDPSFYWLYWNWTLLSCCKLSAFVGNRISRGKVCCSTWQGQEQEPTHSRARNRRRYLISGMRGNNVTFELPGYTDSVL